MITDALTQALQTILTDYGVDRAVVELEHPADEAFGDWSTNAALQYAKHTKDFKNPRAFAAALKQQLEKKLGKKGDIESITVAGPGFLNFTISHSAWLKELASAAQATTLTDLVPQTGEGKKVIVEYSSPNIAKPFTIGHLRSTIIGDALANLYEALGWAVYRDNHVGDWGTQFGKLMYAITTWGDRKKIEAMKRPVKELVALYVRFHQEAEAQPELEDLGRQWFKKLEDGDGEARQLWQWCVDLSWREFDVIYKELGITFTENNGRGYGESFFENRMPQVLEILEEKLPQENFAQNGAYYGEGEDGAKLVFFQDDALPSLMIVKKDGTTLYATRDLATDYFRRQNYDSPPLVINEVGAEQSLYFRQLYAIEEMLGWYQPGQRVHVKHGLYRFKDKKMSTRTGEVIWLEDVIAEAKERALALSKDNETVARQVAMGALKWNDLKSESARDITFDWDEILSMKGNAGPYVQYAAVRAKSVLAKAKKSGVLPKHYAFNEQEIALLRQLSQFADAVAAAAAEFAPHRVAASLYGVASCFNSFYHQHRIVTAQAATQKVVRRALTQATYTTLSLGLGLLGIATPEAM